MVDIEVTSRRVIRAGEKYLIRALVVFIVDTKVTGDPEFILNFCRFLPAGL